MDNSANVIHTIGDQPVQFSWIVIIGSSSHSLPSASILVSGIPTTNIHTTERRVRDAIVVSLHFLLAIIHIQNRLIRFGGVIYLLSLIINTFLSSFVVALRVRISNRIERVPRLHFALSAPDPI